jgi:hypothetical protein
MQFHTEAPIKIIDSVGEAVASLGKMKAAAKLIF